RGGELKQIMHNIGLYDCGRLDPFALQSKASYMSFVYDPAHGGYGMPNGLFHHRVSAEKDMEFEKLDLAFGLGKLEPLKWSTWRVE
ncbi:unnamed protein product, partial [Sphenostylis stenocarpa]